MRRLTAKQEAFAQAVVAGKSLWDAYRSAYDWHGGKTGGEKRATEEARKPAVAGRIQQLRDRAAGPAVLSRARKLERLAAAIEEQVGDGKQLTGDQVRALEVDNRMQGHNEPEQLKVTGLGSVLQKIRRDAPKP